MKTTLPLGAALAVSAILNVALWRREPVPMPVPATRIAAPTMPASAAARTGDADVEVLLLREQVRRLRDQLTVARARVELDPHHRLPLGSEAFDDPDVREFQRLVELVRSFIEFRETQGRTPDGRPARIHKQVLTPENLNAALGVMEQFLGLDTAARRAFEERVTSAVAAYRRDLDAYNLEIAAADKAAEHDEFFEDNSRRKHAVGQRLNQRHEQWMRDHVQPIRDFLGRRDGVRAGLLSDQLAGILTEFGATAER